MEHIPLPNKVEFKPGDKANQAVISIQPCYPGYGTTVGNALRRVLLSSLPGTAVVAFKIKGASHEFSTIKNVKEDLVEISLNLKKLRLKTHSDQPVRLELKTKGEKEVTAKDIKANADVEVISQDLVIATLTDKSAELEMELLVSAGRGYVPTENQNKEGLDVDMIAIDAIYTPIRNVGFQIENVRVGKMTNYENLILNIETDGSIDPREAVSQATQVLMSHFNFLADQTVGQAAEPEKPKKTRKSKAKEVDTTEAVEVKVE